MAACLQELDAADEEDAMCNAVTCGRTTVQYLDPPNYTNDMNIPAAEHWKTVIEKKCKVYAITELKLLSTNKQKRSHCHRGLCSS
jgi:hypothetical protein